jgi:hypothetical protein
MNAMNVKNSFFKQQEQKQRVDSGWLFFTVRLNCFVSQEYSDLQSNTKHTEKKTSNTTTSIRVRIYKEA